MALSSSYVQSLPTCSSDVTQLPALSTVLVDQHRVSRWLLMPPATMSLSVVPAAFFASPIAWSVFCHISSGSCYTQPDFGYCAGGYQHGCNHVRFHHGQQRALWYLWHPGQRSEHKSPCHPLLRRFPGPYPLCSSLGNRVHTSWCLVRLPLSVPPLCHAMKRRLPVIHLPGMAAYSHCRME